MQKDDLKCVLIGRDVKIYSDLAKLVRNVDSSSRFKQVNHTKSAVITTLKKITGPSLIFIVDEIPFSLELLSDLVWHYSADSKVVIVSKNSPTVAFKRPFNNTQFARLNMSKDRKQVEAILLFLIQSARANAEFRRCKSLLGLSEKRCQWLVDSSKEAVAFISREMHWYANTTYLDLFEIASIQELRTVTVKDLITVDEQPLFDAFVRNQNKLIDTNRSILLSMEKLNGAKFRAKIYLIPSVYKNHKCFQFWVRKINSVDEIGDASASGEDNELSSFGDKINSLESLSNEEQVNPFSVLFKDKSSISNSIQKNEIKLRKNSRDEKLVVKESYSLNSLLKGVIRRDEAKIISSPLRNLKDNEVRGKKALKHQMVTLKVAAAQKKGVDELLTNLPGNHDQKTRSIFWDKVKFSRLLQILIQRKQLTTYLLLRVSENSITDKTFVKWLIPGLKRLGRKSEKLVFLIPSNINENEYQATLLFIKQIRKYNCKIALDSFSVTHNCLALLRQTKPDYLRLSLPWTRQLQGNNVKEIQLSSAIRQFEGRNIKVIAPCSFSKDMRKLFVLSGASFCQERTKRIAG